MSQNWLAEDIGASAAVSIDITNSSYAGTLGGKWLLLWWVAPSVVEAGSGYSIDSTCSDPHANPTPLSGGSGDGNSVNGTSGVFSFHYDGIGPWTFDIGYFSPFGALRLDYSVRGYCFQ